MENTWIGWQMFKQDANNWTAWKTFRCRQTFRLPSDIQTGARNPYRQDRKPLDRLVDIQTGMQTLFQAGRRSDRMANT
jgi:hypothetical protein